MYKSKQGHYFNNGDKYSLDTLSKSINEYPQHNAFGTDELYNYDSRHVMGNAASHMKASTNQSKGPHFKP